MRLRLISGPTEWPVSLAESKAQLVVEDNDRDTLIEWMILSVTDWLSAPKGWLNRSLCRQTLELALPEWPCGRDVALPGGPVSAAGGAVTSVKYRDSANAEQTVSASDYLLADDTLSFLPTFARPSTFSRPDAVTIRYTAGHEDPADIDAGLRHAVLMLVTDLFYHRGDMVPGTLVMNPRVEQYLSRYRLWTP